MKRVYELRIPWDDGMTIEYRKFPTREEAEEYVKRNGITKYGVSKIDNY